MKVLLELRPAMDGHSGIPQETRLLFRGLAALPDVEVAGLMQSSNLVTEPGIPVRRGRVRDLSSQQSAIDLTSKVVVSLHQGAAGNRLEYVRKRFLKIAGPLGAIIGSALGRHVPLGVFDATHFKDFVWRALFAKSLPAADYSIVTSREFRVLRWPWSVLHALGVVTSKFGHRAYCRLDTTGFDVALFETPYPARVSAPTKMVVRYHDAIPLLMPHTIKERSYHRAAHYNALCRNVADGAWFACVSQATRNDLLSVFPQIESRAVTIPNMVSHHYYEEASNNERVAEVVWSRKNRDAPHGGGAPIAPSDLLDGSLCYLLMVSTIEPRKNHLALLDAWELLRGSGFPQLNLVVVGSNGWEHESIERRFAPWLQRGGMHMLVDVPAGDLRLLYRHARVTICPSFGEGFDFPGIEAMRCGGVVAASDLPVHRDIFGDASEYFNPYDVDDLASAVRRLIEPDAGPRRDVLIAAGRLVAAQYLPERVLPQWGEFLRKVRA